MNYFLEAFKKYAQFHGRARRAEYWNFVLYSALITIAIGIFESLAGISTNFSGGLLSMLFNLFILIPSLAVGVRRLHDVHTSGWFLLITLIPLVGMIVLIVKLASKGDIGPNVYGQDPKQIQNM